MCPVYKTKNKNIKNPKGTDLYHKKIIYNSTTQHHLS